MLLELRCHFEKCKNLFARQIGNGHKIILCHNIVLKLMFFVYEDKHNLIDIYNMWKEICTFAMIFYIQQHA